MASTGEYSRRDFMTMAGLLGTSVSTGCARSVEAGGRPLSREKAPDESAAAVPPPTTEPSTKSAATPQPPATDKATGSAAREGTVPVRPFGDTGIDVSALALGGYFDAQAHPELLDRALALGVTYWETTAKWGGKGHGAYFQRNPGARESVFLLAKTTGVEPAGMALDLERQLQELHTDRVDFYIAAGISDTAFLDDEVRAWVEASKRAGHIRFFGFSTHKNMATCLESAVALGWIDGVVTTYNYRLMHDPAIRDAIDACAAHGLAVTAIKSQGLPTNPAATIGDDGPAARELLRTLASTGLTEHHAKLMAVWSDPAISSICSLMPDDGTLSSNALAASHWRKVGEASALSLSPRHFGAGDYCSGCGVICEEAVQGAVPIADVMRYLMYARSYGDLERAQAEFRSLPLAQRSLLCSQDYGVAEARCPQRLPIASLMDQAVSELG
jgi:uncharacterized protein